MKNKENINLQKNSTSRHNNKKYFKQKINKIKRKDFSRKITFQDSSQQQYSDQEFDVPIFSLSKPYPHFLFESKTYQKQSQAQSLIGLQIRARVIDWMIQIHEKCNLSERTLFLSVRIFDQFVNSSTNQNLSPNKLHLISLTIILCSSKYEQINYFSIHDIVTKIGYNTFKKHQIINMQAMLLNKIDFKLYSNNLCDYIDYIISEYKISQLSKFNLIKISTYFSRALIHYEQVLQMSNLQTAICIVHISLKSLFEQQQYIQQMCSAFNQDLFKVRQRSVKILQKVKDFDMIFSNLKSLNKYNSKII